MNELSSLEAIFFAALEKGSAQERAAYLDEACAGDSDLRHRVEKMLAAQAHAGSFLESPPSGVASGASRTIDEPRITEGPGTVIGPYKLLEQIGEGGFGVVFMAEQHQPVRRKVALKILKPGMDTRQVVARFEAERQALAIMDHPNIAKVLDGGATASGRPYFVMDLVKGVPITEHCDQNHLTPRERLKLFGSVCHAVQHAHHKGIIHRDLKPSNVLVTMHDTTPLVKVIDFGVAKALGQTLTDKTLFTGFAQMIGTPMYMSPEQAGQSGLDIDMRSDIYSLGVLLYELLTGTTPFDKERLREATYDEIRRIIREEEPPRPSTRVSTLAQAATTAADPRRADPKRLSRELRGELDWIVMKALEKDRSRRYETANGFAMDVQRYLADEPVQACPPSAVYRVRKFARRNQVPLTIAGLVLLILVTLAGSIGWFAGDRAARWAAVDRQVGLALEEATQLMQQANWPAARAWLERAEGLVAGGGSRDEVRRRVSALRNDLDLIQRLEEVRLEMAAVLDGGMSYAEMDARYAQVFRDYGIDLDELGVDEAAERIRQSAVCSELTAMIDDWAMVRRRARGPDEANWKKLLAVAHAADRNELRGHVRTALEHSDREISRELATSAELATLPSPTIVLLADALSASGQTDEAVSVLRTASRTRRGDFWINYELAVHMHNAQPPRFEEMVQFSRVTLALRPQSAAAASLFADALRHNGAVNEAIAEFREAIRLKPDYAEAHNKLGIALCDNGQLDEGVVEHQTAIRLKPDYADAHINLGNALRDKGQLDEAIAEFQTGIRLQPDDALAHYNLGNALRDKGQLDKAIAEYRTAIRLKPDFAAAHGNLGNALRDKGDGDEAIAEYQTAIRLKPDYALAHSNLGGALCAKGQWDEAIAECQTAIRLKPDYAEAYNNLGLALRGKGEFAEGLIQLKRGHELGSRNVVWRYPSARWARECERLVELDGKLPRVLEGDQRPESAAEQLEYADLCYRKRLFEAATGFWERGFAADSALANDMQKQHRYNAACAAALAGCGQGHDAGSIGDEERTRLRQQALDWLRADLESWRKLLEGDSADARATVVGTLKHWQTDSDLAGVRDAEALAKLPEAEREAWGRLWADVGQLLGARE